MPASLVNQTAHFKLVNTYLVPHDGGLILIDAAVPGQAKNILAAAAALNAGPITTIALTHAHPDHVGSLKALLAELPGVELILSEREAEVAAGDASTRPGETPKKAPVRNVSIGKAKPTRTVNDGDTIGPLQVIAAPGHSPGQIAFHDPRDGSLYCGDAFANLGLLASTHKIALKSPIPAAFTWDKPAAQRTSQKLADLAPARLAPGHGKVVEDPTAAMHRAAAR